MNSTDTLHARLSQAGARIEYLHGFGWRFCLGAAVCDRVPQLDVALLIIRRDVELRCVRPFPAYVLRTQASGARREPERVNAVAYQVRAS